MQKNIIAAVAALALAGVIVAINWPVATEEGASCAEAVAGVKGFQVSKGEKTALDVPFYLGEEGLETRLKDFAGKGVVLNFWATWCSPCIKEMPSVRALKKSAPAGIEVMAVSEDREGVKVAKPFLEKNGWQDLGIVVDKQSALLRSLKIIGLPTTVLIAPDGGEAARLTGIAEWDGPAVARILDACIKPKG